jgi:hypothetical protein
VEPLAVTIDDALRHVTRVFLDTAAAAETLNPEKPSCRCGQVQRLVRPATSPEVRMPANSTLVFISGARRGAQGQPW